MEYHTKQATPVVYRLNCSWDRLDDEAAREGKAIRDIKASVIRVVYGRRTMQAKARNQINSTRNGLGNKVVKHRLGRRPKVGS